MSCVLRAEPGRPLTPESPSRGEDAGTSPQYDAVTGADSGPAVTGPPHTPGFCASGRVRLEAALSGAAQWRSRILVLGEQITNE
jgi:hypothetical protein